MHILLLHHAQGLTPGLRSIADDLRAAGHEVTTPDLYDGATFATVDEGVEHAKSIGFGQLLERGIAAADPLPSDTVYVGFSLGCMPAQSLAQNRPGAAGCVLLHGAAQVEEFGGPWPEGVPAQVHIAREDPWEDLDYITTAAQEMSAELFVYDGDAHLFTDASVSDHRPEQAATALARLREFLDSLS